MSRPILYGDIPFGLAEVPDDAVQVSPLSPNSASLEKLAADTYSALFMRAPANTAERQHDMALALRALKPGAPFTILAPKQKGGTRLLKELEAFGVMAADQPKRHHRICTGLRPADLRGIEAAIEKGAMQLVAQTGLYAQPGMFSWDRVDAGTALLLAHLPNLYGAVADFGCGTGQLALAVLKSPKVKQMAGLDCDRRAIEAAGLNIRDTRFTSIWTDIRSMGSGLKNQDFVVMNPPFHDSGEEDQGLGMAFIARAAEALRAEGTLWLTANRHLPYEAVLKASFKAVTPRAEGNGYKIYEAIK